MTTQEIVQKLTAYCNAAKFDEAYNTLFAQHAKSIEPDGTIAEGLAAIHQKSENFGAAVQFVSCELGAVQVAGNYFSMVQTYHSIIHATGEQKRMERFFY